MTEVGNETQTDGAIFLDENKICVILCQLMPYRQHEAKSAKYRGFLERKCYFLSRFWSLEKELRNVRQIFFFRD